MVKRLSRDGYGTYKPDKEILYIKSGVEVKEVVSHRQWEKEVINNPNGKTALRARQENDPDLKAIEIPIVTINHNHKVPNQVKALKENKFVNSTTPKHFKPNIEPDTARRWGWRTAEEGKGGKMHKLPMLEDKEDKSK